MKLKEVLDSLDATKFLSHESSIQIVVTKGKSLKNEDHLFECYVPPSVARHFFGEADVVLNKLKKYGEFNIPTFWFLISYQGN